MLAPVTLACVLSIGLVEKVQAKIAKQPEAKLWSICDQRWDVLTRDWRSQPPKTIFRFVRASTKELLRLANTVSGREVAVTTIAMYLLQAYDPRLFKSETAFRTQLVRRVRGPSSGSFGKWDSASDGRKRRAMKELEPKTTEWFSGILVELFGPAGLKVAQPHDADHAVRFAHGADKRIGFQPAPRYRWLETEARMRSLIEAAVAEMVAHLARDGIQASFEPQDKILSLDGKVTVTIGAARSLCEGHCGKRWRVKTDRSATTSLTLIFRMEETNTSLKDYYLLPTSEIARTRVKKLRMTSRVFSNSSRLETLDQVVYALTALKSGGRQIRL